MPRPFPRSPHPSPPPEYRERETYAATTSQLRNTVILPPLEESMNPLKLPLLLSFFVLLAGIARPAAAADNPAAGGNSKPNVLFIAIDDLNHWVGWMHRNDQTATPNIDRLASRGV